MKILSHTIETISISEVKLDEKNPNQMTKQQLQSLVESLKAFGNLQPIILDQDNNVVDGAHRVLAYKELNSETIPAIRIKIENDADRRIIRQTMNKLRGKHDLELDAAEFVEILKQNSEKKLFDVSNIKESDFYKTISNFGKSNRLQDELPEQVEAITKPGDIWILGEHRLMCGDSTEKDNIDKLMKGDKAHLVITDPPYGVDYVNQIAGREGTTGKWKHIENDELKGKALQEFCEKFLISIKNNTTEDSAYYIFFGMKTFHHLIAAMDKVGIYYALPLIWVKGRPTISWAKYHPDYEVVAYGGEGAKPRRFRTEMKMKSSGQSGNNYKPAHEPIAFAGEGASPRQPRWFAHYDQTTCWFEKPDTSIAYEHPTQKPVTLAERALLNSSKEGEVVLDLFTGSGFALIACHKLNRVFRGMEKDPNYCDIAVKRWEIYSGMTAKKEENNG